MPACKDLDNKYLRKLSNRILVEIPQYNYVKSFFYRDYSSYEKTILASIENRNTKFKELSGYNLSKRSYHHKSRTKDARLEPGLSFGYSRGKKAYVVLTFTPRPNDTSIKVRYSIKKLGEDKAIKAAKKKLKTLKKKDFHR